MYRFVLFALIVLGSNSIAQIVDQNGKDIAPEQPAIVLVDDAPISDLPGSSVRLKAGDSAPFNGRLLSDAEQVRRGKLYASDRAELAELKKPDVVVVNKVVLIVLIVGAAALGAAVTGFTVAQVNAGKPPTP